MPRDPGNPHLLIDQPPNWLPPLVTCSNLADWTPYEAALFGYYKADFIDARPVFDGRKVQQKRHPEIGGLPATFWHVISEGDGDDRTPDFRRCERIRWPGALIAHAGDPNCVCRWDEHDHHKGYRVCLTLKDFSYLVVLDDRSTFVLLWTAYCVERQPARDKLAKRYAHYTSPAGQPPAGPRAVATAPQKKGWGRPT